jgi:hypothetical protein
MNAWTCESGQNNGGAHQWGFRGHGKGYLCILCAAQITKDDLKKETD